MKNAHHSPFELACFAMLALPILAFTVAIVAYRVAELLNN